MQNGRQSAILDPMNSIFGVQLGLLGIHAQTKYQIDWSSGVRNFRLKVIPSTDGRRTTDAK